MRLLIAIAVLAAVRVHAQFFQHFFGGGNAEPEREASSVGDASWFQERVANGMCEILTSKV